MAKDIKITIENRLVMEKRDLNVYHHFSRSAHMISHGSSITFSFRSVIEDDYLHVSIVSGPGRLEGNCVVTLPPWVNFELFSAGDATVTHSEDRTFLKIPPGPPIWQIRMTRSLSSLIDQPSDHITVGDVQPEGL